MEKTRITLGRLLALVAAALPFNAPPFRAHAQWIEIKSAHYTVFYQAGFEKDAEFTIGHYAAQDSRASGGWKYYSAPEWFVQGLQEYDGIFHTTENNRTMTAKRLLEWAKRNPSKFSCCSPKLAIADVYNGGAAFMAFLANEFGEDIHARLLRNPANTFEAALSSETKPYSLVELFDRFRKWLDQLQI